MARHYLDHASSSPLRPEAQDALRNWLAQPAADPGRLHEEGRVVRAAVEQAREDVAALLGVRPRQVIFTSGATEAINTAVWAATRARPGAAVLCAGVEHSAVREASVRLAPVESLPVDPTGLIDPDAVVEALAAPRTRPPALVHCQWANHEVATLQRTSEIVQACRQAGVPVHVDAAAACGHTVMDLGRLGADYVSISAHKFGGPPGIGGLVLHRGVRMEPLLVGSLQERGRRAGMENVPGIVGLGAVAAALARDGEAQMFREEAEARRRIARLVEEATSLEDVTVVGDPDPDHRLPHLVCLGVGGVEAEPVLLGLDRLGIAVHSGSACSSESLAPSPVLEAMEVDSSRSLRVSVGWSTTDADIDAFCHHFPEVVAALRSLRSQPTR